MRGWMRAAAALVLGVGLGLAVPNLLAILRPPPSPPAAPHLVLSATSFSELPGWSEDNLAAALPAFLKTCVRWARLAADGAVGPAGVAGRLSDWRGACAAAAAAGSEPDSVRRLFETTFTPYAATNGGDPTGLFTGYYEPVIEASREEDARFSTPILRRPPDLVTVDLGQFRPSWRGERIAGHVAAGALAPYATRAEIEAGSLDRRRLALFWLEDPIDAFFLEIQGAGRLRLRDGALVRVGYDGQNGRAYVPIGRLLVERGELTREAASMAGIRAWLKEHPDREKALMDENPSYVFFREIAGEGPVGAEGAVLTAGRSLAVDRAYLPLGVPIWLDLGEEQPPLRRLMVAQDTGGAIRGPVRGDVFFGTGEEAGEKAGALRARGRYFLLLPKGVIPAAELH